MKIIIICFCLAIYSLETVKAQTQTLVSTKEINFEITGNQKDQKGFPYTFSTVSLVKGQILIASAVADLVDFHPIILFKGPIINGKEVVPEIIHQSDRTQLQFEGIYKINETGNYDIAIFAAEKGTISKGKLKLGLANQQILNNTMIMAMPIKNDFTDALSANLRQAIFNFNFEKKSIARGEFAFSDGRILDSLYIPIIRLPNSIMYDGIATKVGTISTADKNNIPILISGVQYCYGYIKCPYSNYALTRDLTKLDKKESILKLYDFKDTVLLIKTYDSLKNVLINSLSKDFTIERETLLPIPYDYLEDKNRPKNGAESPNGRSIVFTHKGNDKLLPNKHGFNCLAEKQMKIEVCLKSDLSKNYGVYIRIYSHGETLVY